MIKKNMQPAIDIIKSFEGIADGDPTTVNLDPYLCPAGYWTIGWGHVVRDSRGAMIRGAENKRAARAIYPNGITRQDADRLLQSDVFNFALCVDELVKVHVSDNQFCALVSFAFNVGIGAFERSTLLLLLNKRDFDAIPAQFMRWTKIEGKESRGLMNRRKAEVELWSNAHNE